MHWDLAGYSWCLKRKLMPSAEARSHLHGSSTSSRVVPPEVARAELEACWNASGRPWALRKLHPPIYTGATGASVATAEEAAFLAAHPDAVFRAIGTSFGHLSEAQFPLALALASLSISRGALIPPNDTSGREIEIDVMPSQVVAVGVGHCRGEGMALVEAV